MAVNSGVIKLKQQPKQGKSLPILSANLSRYSPDTLRKVVEMAARLQMETRETLTAEEVEAIGREVGLEPTFVRQAMAELHSKSTAAQPRSRVLSEEMRESLVAAWWAAG